MPETQIIHTLRSPLARARGLGATRTGSHHWWLQRVTAAALLPLTLWFIFSVVSLLGEPREAITRWLSSPLSLGLMLALIIATFHHLYLGLQVVIEDYVHQEAIKLGSILAMRGACLLLALICIVSVLKIGL